MRIVIDNGEPKELDGDPVELGSIAASAAIAAVYRGETVFIAPAEGPFDWCEKCERYTANHEPRLRQEVRYSKGYYTCPICGYIKEGVTPNVGHT